MHVPSAKIMPRDVNFILPDLPYYEQKMDMKGDKLGG